MANPSTSAVSRSPADARPATHALAEDAAGATRAKALPVEAEVEIAIAAAMEEVGTADRGGPERASSFRRGAIPVGEYRSTWSNCKGES